MFTDKKPWLDKYNEKIRKGLSAKDMARHLEEEAEELNKDERATQEMECPKCRHNKVYYTSRQMRSADEGETVIYECVKCE